MDEFFAFAIKVLHIMWDIFFFFFLKIFSWKINFILQKCISLFKIFLDHNLDYMKLLFQIWPKINWTLFMVLKNKKSNKTLCSPEHTQMQNVSTQWTPSSAVHLDTWVLNPVGIMVNCAHILCWWFLSLSFLLFFVTDFNFQ